MQPSETWLPIPGYEGLYEVSDLGRVRSVDRAVTLTNRYGKPEVRRYKGKMLRPGAQASGHVTVAVGKNNSQGVHRLVLLAFEGPCPEGCEALHRNGDPGDNALANLRWGARSENLEDIFYHTGRRLTREQVLFLRQRAVEGFAYGERYQLARAWGVNPGAIWHTLSGNQYRHVV